MLPFGEWMPDLPPNELQGATVATNVIPDARSYRSFPSLAAYSGALAARAQGGIFATDASRANHNIAGDATTLYLLNGASWGAATSGFTTNTDEHWEFAQWGDTVIAVNGHNDDPQQLSLTALTFVPLAGGPPRARHIAAMRDFIVVGNTDTSPYQVRWSAINDAHSWTANATTLADSQLLPSEGGWVQKVLGGEYGVVLQERRIWRMLFVGPPLIFQFDAIQTNVGAYAAQGAVRWQNLTFFLSNDGFYSFDGANINPIGRGKVDRFFLTDLNPTWLHRVHAAIDPHSKLVMWAYPSSASVDGVCDRIIIYSWAFNRWTLISGVAIELLLLSITTGYTLEDLDAFGSIDALAWSLDSDQWTGGSVILSAFDSTHKLGRFTATPMAATVDTGEFQLVPGYRSTVYSVRPYLDGENSDCTIQIYTRERLNQPAAAAAPAQAPNDTGFAETLVSGRYMRIRLTTNGDDFTHLMGVDLESAKEGVR